MTGYSCGFFAVSVSFSHALVFTQDVWWKCTRCCFTCFFFLTYCNGNVNLQFQSLFPWGQVSRKGSETLSCNSNCCDWEHKNINHLVEQGKEVGDAAVLQSWIIYQSLNYRWKCATRDSSYYLRHFAWGETPSIQLKLSFFLDNCCARSHLNSFYKNANVSCI